MAPKTATTTAFLKLAPLVFVRPGDLRCAQWADWLDSLRDGGDAVTMAA